MQTVAVLLWDSGLIWLMIPMAALFLRSFALALGCSVTFLCIGWVRIGESLAIGPPTLATGTGLAISGVRNRWQDDSQGALLTNCRDVEFTSCRLGAFAKVPSDRGHSRRLWRLMLVWWLMRHCHHSATRIPSTGAWWQLRQCLCSPGLVPLSASCGIVMGPQSELNRTGSGLPLQAHSSPKCSSGKQSLIVDGSNGP